MFLLMELSLVPIIPDDRFCFWQKTNPIGIGSLHTSLKNIYHRMHPKILVSKAMLCVQHDNLQKKINLDSAARMAKSRICLKWNCFCTYKILRSFYLKCVCLVHWVLSTALAKKLVFHKGRVVMMSFNKIIFSTIKGDYSNGKDFCWVVSSLQQHNEAVWLELIFLKASFQSLKKGRNLT